MNPKLQKITGEIEKTKVKISEYQSRLRELERQKTELENADLLALVRGIDIDTDEFAEFVRAYKERREYGVSESSALKIETDKEEDLPIEN